MPCGPSLSERSQDEGSPPRTNRHLNSLLLEDKLFESADALLQRVGWHYAMQVLQSVYRLVGSLDLLGNPAAIFSDVSGGVTQLVSGAAGLRVKSPAAFAQGLVAGSAGLAGGVIGGTSAGLLGVFSAVARGAENVTTALAFDPAYSRRRQACT